MWTHWQCAVSFVPFDLAPFFSGLPSVRGADSSPAGWSRERDAGTSFKPIRQLVTKANTMFEFTNIHEIPSDHVVQTGLFPPEFCFRSADFTSRGLHTFWTVNSALGSCSDQLILHVSPACSYQLILYGFRLFWSADTNGSCLFWSADWARVCVWLQMRRRVEHEKQQLQMQIISLSERLTEAESGSESQLDINRSARGRG